MENKNRSKVGAIKFVIGSLLIWWAGLFIISFLAQSLIPRIDNHRLFESSLSLRQFFQPLTNWDGGHYIGIAENGYVLFKQYAFFPFYPFLIKVLAFIFGENYLLSALLISNLSLIGSLIMLHKLIKLDFSEKIAKRTIIYFLFFPTAFFLIAAYSESLFIFLIISAFYFARKSNYLVSSLFVAAASATRPLGILIILPILFEYLYARKFRLSKIDFSIMYFLLSFLGLFSYLLFLKFELGNPFVFIAAQSYWQRFFTVNPFYLIWDSYLKLFSLNGIGTANFTRLLLNFAVIIITIVATIFSYKKIRPSYLIYMILMLLSPLISGSLTSMIRLVLPIFPLFLILSVAGENQFFDYFYKLQALLLLALLFGLFINGYWVA